MERTGTADLDEPEEEQLEVEPRFSGFFEDQYVRLVRGLTLILGDVSDAEDVAQEAMIRVLERWDRVSRMESPDGYLFRVGVNLARRRRRVNRVLAWRHDFVVDSMSDVVVRADMLRAMKALPPKYRDALVLVDWFDRPVTDYAQSAGIPAATARVRIHRARLELRRLLGGGYED